jgi:hypothetical protein
MSHSTFDPSRIHFSTLEKTGKVESGPAGAMADYSITASYGDITKEMSFKVLHEVMNPAEVDPYMYESAQEMARMSLSKILADAVIQKERDTLVKEHSEGIVDGDTIRIEDIKFGEFEVKKDFVTITGTFMGHTMSANCNLTAYDGADKAGHREKVLLDMKFSLLHAFRSAHYRLSRATKPL